MRSMRNFQGDALLLNKLKVPVIQAPMAGGITTPEMVACVSNHGLLGMIPSGYLSLEALENFIVKTKKLMNDEAIYGLNIFIEKIFDQKYIFDKSRDVISAENTLTNEKVDSTFTVPTAIEECDYVDMVIKHNIPVVSTTFGLLSKKSIDKLTRHNVEVIATVTSIKEAELALELNIKVLIFQGFEAGGHQASFESNQLNRMSTMSLIREASTKFTNIQMIASGGISPHNMMAFFMNGADFVQMGSIFMMSDLSGLSVTAKNHIQNNFNTIVSRKITGRYARGIVNKFDQMNEPLYDFPTQHYHTAELRKKAKHSNCFEYASLWVGSNIDNVKIGNLNELISDIKSVLKDYRTNETQK